jgi:GTP-binding protein HflX
LTGEGTEELLQLIETIAMATFEPISVFLPYRRGDLLSLFHERGQVEAEEHGGEGVKVDGRLPSRLIPYFTSYQL